MAEVWGRCEELTLRLLYFRGVMRQDCIFGETKMEGDGKWQGRKGVLAGSQLSWV